MTAVTLTIDASALAKLIAQEPDSGIYRACIDIRTTLVAPAHIWAETGEVLRRKLRSGDIDLQHIERAVEGLRTRLRIIDLDELLLLAIRLSIDVDVSVYDALYLAVGLRENAKLLTAEWTFDRAGAAVRLQRVAPAARLG